MRGRRRVRLASVACVAAIAAALVSGCGGDDSEGTSLKWFIAIQPGGSIQEVAETCSRQSGGRYDIELELLPTDAVLNDHLGDAYWRVGRRLEARFQWNHARDLDPEPDLLAEVFKKLKDGLPPVAYHAAGASQV